MAEFVIWKIKLLFICIFKSTQQLEMKCKMIILQNKSICYKIYPHTSIYSSNDSSGGGEEGGRKMVHLGNIFA